MNEFNLLFLLIVPCIQFILQAAHRFSIERSTPTTGGGSTSVVPEENEEIEGQNNEASPGGQLCS